MKRIGLLLQSNEWGQIDIFSGVQQYCLEEKLEILSDENGNISLTLEKIKQLKPDGIISNIHIVRPNNLKWIKWLPQSKIPFIDIGGLHNSDQIPSVISDEKKVAELAAYHFNERGYQVVYFIGNHDLQIIQQRLQVFTQTLSSLNKTCRFKHFISGNDSWKTLKARLKKWLHTLPRPSAIFASHDNLGRMLCAECLELGFKIPQDFAILGVADNPKECALSTPPLSSIPINLKKMGYLAARALHQRLEGNYSQKFPILVSPEKVQSRYSTNIFAYGDEKLNQILSYIRENAHKSITIDHVLEKFPMSRRSLEIKFRQTLNRSPNEEITYQKLVYAKRLLWETTLTLEDISERSGFTTASYFIRVFKKHFSVTPTEYRKDSISHF